MKIYFGANNYNYNNWLNNSTNALYKSSSKTYTSEESESESERYLFDPHKKFIQSNNEQHLGSGDPY